METVLRISAKRDAAERQAEAGVEAGGHQGGQTNGGQQGGSHRGGTGHHGHGEKGSGGGGGAQHLDINPGVGKPNREASLETTHEGDVDRIVTHDNAVFVLSKPRCVCVFFQLR